MTPNPLNQPPRLPRSSRGLAFFLWSLTTSRKRRLDKKREDQTPAENNSVMAASDLQEEETYKGQRQENVYEGLWLGLAPIFFLELCPLSIFGILTFQQTRVPAMLLPAVLLPLGTPHLALSLLVSPTRPRSQEHSHLTRLLRDHMPSSAAASWPRRLPSLSSPGK